MQCQTLSRKPQSIQQSSPHPEIHLKPEVGISHIWILPHFIILLFTFQLLSMKVFTPYFSFPKISKNFFISVLYERENIFKGLLKKVNKHVLIQNKKSENVNFLQKLSTKLHIFLSTKISTGAKQQLEERLCFQ